MTDRVPVVSVIIPAYNVAPFIGDTLRSVLAQTFSEYEVIIINDGSPDTVELETVLAPYLDRITYLKQHNQGAGAARNTGLRAARGEFVAFLDGDDEWVPTFLEKQIRLIRSGPGYDLVYADAQLFGNSPKARGTVMQREPSDGPVTFESLLAERCLINTSTVVARREPILEVGLFDVTLRNSQDFDLWVRLAKRNGARMTYQREVLARHRVWNGSLASDGIKSVEGELKVLAKVSQRADLTPGEREALSRTVSLRSASVEVDRGKRSLLHGEFEAAAKSFRFANDYYRNWKLTMVLWCLRIAPQLLRRVYQLRAT
jgi:Glycosyltransferases involved in cell wall biogenesis